MNLLFTLLLLAPEQLPQRMEWQIDGVAREALVVLPMKPSDAGAPVVFVFHGHGGNMKNTANRMAIHKHWPEALCVYAQGLPSVGKGDPDGKKPGWQRTPGDLNDRDLKLVDAMLQTFKQKQHIDERRIYATGHSNGGAFTYLLWAARSDIFAAYAPSASAGARLLKDAKPRPVLHVAGQKDTTVPFETQKAAMEAIRKYNGCSDAGQSWAPECTLYSSSKGAPVVTFIHDGDHTYPAEAVALIARFFKEHIKP